MPVTRSYLCARHRQNTGYVITGSADTSAVIYNRVDHEYFDRKPNIEQGAEFRAQHGIPEEAHLIACIAGFRIEKWHGYLIEAFNGLTDSYLVLAGDGVQWYSIEQLIVNSGVGD